MNQKRRLNSPPCLSLILLLIFSNTVPALAVSRRARLSIQQRSAPPIASPTRDELLWQRALKLHRSAIIVDGHNDIPTIMVDDDYDIATPSAGKYHTDLARMKQGGLTGEFFFDLR